MATNVNNVNYPLGTATPNVDDDMRKERLDVFERIVQGGHKIAAVTLPVPSVTENTDGLHCVGVETQVNQNESGYFTLVSSFDGATPYLRVYGSTHATKPLQIEALNAAKYIGPNVTSGLDPGHLHTQGGVIGGRSGLIGATGYLKPSAFRWAKGANEGTQTILALYARVGTAPSGGTLVIEVRKTVNAPLNAQDVYTDGVASVIVGTLTIAAGEFGASVTGLAVTVIDGEVIVLKATTVTGNPADLSVSAVISG